MSEGRKPRSHRPDRMADFVREEVAQFLLNGLKDPRIGFITVTNVKMTVDLKTARVYYSVFGSDKEKQETEEALSESLGKIRSHLSKKMHTRFSPRLEFFVDEGLENSYRVQELLGSINRAET